MSPEFAAVVDPVIREILDVFSLIESQPPGLDVEHLKTRLVAAIERARSRVRGSPSGDWELAEYALVALVDEVLSVPGTIKGWDESRRKEWEQHILERHFYGERERAPGFYAKAEEATRLASRDALETFVTAVLLGFVGEKESGRREWLDRHQAMLQPRLAAAAPFGVDAETRGAPPLNGHFRLVWAGLATVFSLACVVVTAWRVLVRQ